MKKHMLLCLFLLMPYPLWSAEHMLPRPVVDTDYAPVNRDEAELGQLLFYDPILSGNRNISCATCHHPKFGTTDGVSLSLGEGGIGLGPERRADPDNLPEQRIPRHAQALFNLGAREFTVLFHDGRIEVDTTRKSGLRTPLEEEMVTGFASLLSAQTMFPVLSQDEMAGHYSENQISKAVRQGRITGDGAAWDLIARRITQIPEYQRKFSTVYPDIKSGRAIAFTDISNAIAAFVEYEWRSDNSAFDAFLRGQEALPAPAQAGLALFYGPAGCAACHAGTFQTDHAFHAMGVPQFGPGKAARFETHARDTGRMRVTGRTRDAYAFRTPSLRNVTATAPYGHTGAFATLENFLHAHLSPREALNSYDRGQAILSQLDVSDWRILDDATQRHAIADAITSQGPDLTDIQITQLIAFLETLSDPVALQGRLGIPDRVPSGLPVER